MFARFNVSCWRALALLSILLLLLSACGDEPTPAPEQIISKAAEAIKSPTSFHVVYEASKPDKPVPGFYLTRAEGDVQKPDKLQADVSASYGGLAINVKAIVVGDKQFMTDPTSGQWQQASSVLDIKQFFDPAKGVGDILASVKQPKNDGKENVGGTDTYRLTGQVPTSAMKSLSPEVTASGDLTGTLWIGTADSLLRKVRLEGPFADTDPEGVVRTITFSDYNKPVTISPPAANQ